MFVSFLFPFFVELGAGFYLNATQEKWKNWQMYDYVVKELPKLLSENFEQLDTSRASISGHSMGGHGALTIYLKNLDKYKVIGKIITLIFFFKNFHYLPIFLACNLIQDQRLWNETFQYCWQLSEF